MKEPEVVQQNGVNRLKDGRQEEAKITNKYEKLRP